jgi:polyisoprenoid-binding protein YceI
MMTTLNVASSRALRTLMGALSLPTVAFVSLVIPGSASAATKPSATTKAPTTTVPKAAAGKAAKTGGPQAGAPCSVGGNIVLVNGVRLICVKNGKKLVWQQAETVPGGTGTFPSTTTTVAGATTVPGAVTLPVPGSPAAGAPPSIAVPASDPVGAWVISPGSVAGYRIQEQLLGGAFAGTKVAVGRTELMAGSLRVEKVKTGLLASVSMRVNMTQLKSDSPKRDQVLKTEGLTTSQYPEAFFSTQLTVPPGADTGKDFAVKVTGEMAIRGVTRPVTVNLVGRFELGRILMVGNAVITLADFGITPPDVAGVVDVADQGEIEFSLIFVKA